MQVHDQLDEAVTVFQQYSNRPDLTVRENVMEGVAKQKAIYEKYQRILVDNANKLYGFR